MLHQWSTVRNYSTNIRWKYVEQFYKLGNFPQFVLATPNMVSTDYFYYAVDSFYIFNKILSTIIMLCNPRESSKYKVN